MTYAWIEAHEGFYGVGELCRALMVSPSGYRAWQRGGTPSRQRQTEAQLITLNRRSMPNTRALTLGGRRMKGT
jgi:putative transposase